MKTINIFTIIFLLCFFGSSCVHQKLIQNDDLYPAHSIIPCFQSEHPTIINLPDSFEFSQNSYTAFFYTSMYFDSLGNALEMIPFQLFIKNKITGKLLKEFVYRESWEDSAINITKYEAMRYVIWAEKALPLVTKLKRYPPNIKCNEKITNRIVRMLEYKLE